MQIAKETKEIAERMKNSNIENVIHAAKIKRAAEAHGEIARRFRGKAQEEI